MTRCCFCLRPLLPAQTQYLEVVHGWAPVRKKGANAIRQAEYSGRTACEMCLTPVVEQLSLFD